MIDDAVLIETERLLLTGWRADQLDDLMRLHGDPVIARYLTAHGQPWSRDEAEEALTHWRELFATQRLGKLRAVRKSDGVLVGRAGYGVYPITGEPEIGYSLYREHWGNGYATEAASALRDWLYRETAWDHFIGMADVRNAASLKILGAIGMERTHLGPNETGQVCQFFIHRRPAA